MNRDSDITQISSGQAALGSRFADLVELTKPRMNALVVVTMAVGYYMAARVGHSLNWPVLFHAIIGTGLTAAAASVLNQYAEREYDGLMPRTRNRPLPAGRVGAQEALVLGIVLAVVGLAYLAAAVNVLTALLGALTLCSYVFIYTPMKRLTSLNTVVGAIPGAIPPMMGWSAAHGAISPEALVLFGILFLWQMPHFLAIAILYKDDYAAGGFKMLPVGDEDLAATSRQIVLYSLALIPASLLPVALGMAGSAYFCVAVLAGLGFLTFGISCAVARCRADARKLFFASIIYLPLLLAALMIDKL
jgi:protoheme IX farnesyltransferase